MDHVAAPEHRDPALETEEGELGALLDGRERPVGDPLGAEHRVELAGAIQVLVEVHAGDAGRLAEPPQHGVDRAFPLGLLQEPLGRERDGLERGVAPKRRLRPGPRRLHRRPQSGTIVMASSDAYGCIIGW